MGLQIEQIAKATVLSFEYIADNKGCILVTDAIGKGQIKYNKNLELQPNQKQIAIGNVESQYNQKLVYSKYVNNRRTIEEL